jgi:hypothetical protein
LAITIEPLGKHARAAFSCGQPDLDDWFRHRASQDEKRNVSRVFVAVDGALGIVGFYTLSSFKLALEDLPEAIARKLPRYPDIPAALIGRLARDSRARHRLRWPSPCRCGATHIERWTIDGRFRDCRRCQTRPRRRMLPTLRLRSVSDATTPAIPSGICRGASFRRRRWIVRTPVPLCPNPAARPSPAPASTAAPAFVSPSPPQTHWRSPPPLAPATPRPHRVTAPRGG